MSMQEAVEKYVTAAEALRKIFAQEDGEASWLDEVVIDFIKTVVQARTCNAARFC